VAESYNKPKIVVSEGSRDIGNWPYFEGNELAPIVLVHGIFGFRKGVSSIPNEVQFKTNPEKAFQNQP